MRQFGGRIRAAVGRADRWLDGDLDSVVIAVVGLAAYVRGLVVGSDPAWWLAAPLAAVLVSAVGPPVWRRLRGVSADDRRQND